MSLGDYFSKMRGTDKRPFRLGIGRDRVGEVFWASLGGGLGIGVTALLSARFFEPRDALLILGSFGASAVLIYGVILSPLAQPRNLIGGHVISAVIGVAVFQIAGRQLHFSRPRRGAGNCGHDRYGHYPSPRRRNRPDSRHRRGYHTRAWLPVRPHASGAGRIAALVGRSSRKQHSQDETLPTLLGVITGVSSGTVA